MNKPALLVILVALLGGCTTAHRPIPDGVYYSDSGVDVFVVDGSTLFFMGFSHRNCPDCLVKWPYTYEVLPDGRIFVPMLSWDWIDGMGRYQLFWEDGAIMITQEYAWREVWEGGKRVTRRVEIEKGSRPTSRFVRVR